MLGHVVLIQCLFSFSACTRLISISMPYIPKRNNQSNDIAYDMFNRKLFSLPKLIILPGVIARQPMLLIKIFPFIFITDMLKGRIVASVTDRVEQIQRDARDINSIRQKVEQFDMKNAELLRRSGTGATQYTQRRWDELTLEYQALMAAGDLLRRTRGFFLWYVSAGELVPKMGAAKSQR